MIIYAVVLKRIFRIRTHVTEIQLMQRKVPVILGNNFWMTETFWFSSNVVDWQRDDLVDLLIKWSIDWLVDWLILSVSYFVLSNIEPSRTIHISAWNKLWNSSLYIPLCIYAQPELTVNAFHTSKGNTLDQTQRLLEMRTSVDQYLITRPVHC